MMLTYLLARSGVNVTLLEAHQDFDRDFRGDSLHPYTLELLDTLGLAGALLALPHHRARWFRLHTPSGEVTLADYGKLATPFNYVALMPQARFLNFLAEAAGALPGCTVRTGAKVTSLLPDATGTVRGVIYRDSAGEHELTAELVVAADGRFSRIRRLSGLPARPMGVGSDVLWFRLPRRATDPPEADLDLYVATGHYIGVLGGVEHWQIGYSLAKGGYPAARDAGVGPIRAFVAEHVPWLADRAELLTEFSQTTLLSVEISYVDTWYRPGVLLIGDAAHVISPVGGNGILMAIQDAVAAANRLVPVLRAGTVSELDLAAVQSARESAIQAVQARQVRAEHRVARTRRSGPPISLLRLVTGVPGAKARAARTNAYGPQSPQLDITLLTASPPT